jgi:antitoxin VapB
VTIPPDQHVKLFRFGGDQAVRIPREFELPGEDAIMRKEGKRLIIELAQVKSLLEPLVTMTPLEEEFPPFLDLPPTPSHFQVVSAEQKHYPLSYLYASGCSTT